MNLPIYILIPTHKRDSLLRKLLKSINSCIIPNDKIFEIILVENGFRSSSELILHEEISNFNFTYVYYPTGNKSEALNSVIANLPNSFIIFLDDDVFVSKNFLTSYLQHLNCKNSFFGGPLLIDYEKSPPDWMKKYLPRSAVGWHPEIYEPMGNLFFFGANWAAFSNDVLDAGMFRTDLGPGGLLRGPGEEEMLQNKLFHNGLTPVYVKDAIVWHYVPRERCSYSWALKRAFREGVTSGLISDDFIDNRNFFNIPFWMCKKLFFSLCNVIKSFFSFSIQIFFNSLYNFFKTSGIAYGYHIKTKSEY